jgi:hypothetical protein
MNIKWLVLIILFLTMPGCKKDEKVVDAETPPQSSARANVDFGGVEHVSITAKGYGKTLSQAVDDALKRGIEQVNGKRVHASTDSVNLTYDISVGGYSVEI